MPPTTTGRSRPPASSSSPHRLSAPAPMVSVARLANMTVAQRHQRCMMAAEGMDDEAETDEMESEVLNRPQQKAAAHRAPRIPIAGPDQRVGQFRATPDRTTVRQPSRHCDRRCRTSGRDRSNRGPVRRRGQQRTPRHHGSRSPSTLRSPAPSSGREAVQRCILGPMGVIIGAKNPFVTALRTPMRRCGCPANVRRTVRLSEGVVT